MNLASLSLLALVLVTRTNGSSTSAPTLLRSFRLDTQPVQRSQSISVNPLNVTWGETPIAVHVFENPEEIDEDVLPPVEQWPHRPLFLQDSVGTSSNDPCPVGIPFEFESDLFKGRALIRVRNLDASHDSSGSGKYFEGTKRLSQVVIQGRFKENVRVDDVFMGSEFTKPLKMKPPPFIAGIVRRVLQAAAPGVEVDLGSDQPKVLAPFGGSMEVIRADSPGLEPDISSADGIQENNPGFFGGNFASKVRDSLFRKKIFSDLKQAKDYEFNTDTVYTFETYDESLDYADYTLDAKLFQFDLTQTLVEPFQFMAKSKSRGKHLWNFQLWHEKLLDQ